MVLLLDKMHGVCGSAKLPQTRLTHPFVALAVLQLTESSADSSDVALLIGECHTARSFRVLQLRVCVDSSVTHSSIQTIHYHGQLHWNINTYRLMMWLTGSVRQC